MCILYIHLGGKIGLPSGCGNSSLNVQYDTILTYPQSIVEFCFTSIIFVNLSVSTGIAVLHSPLIIFIESKHCVCV